MSKRTGRTRALAIVISLLTLSLLAGCSPKPASQPTSAPTQETAQPTVAPSQQAQEPEAGKQPEDYTGTVLFWTWDDNYSNYMNPAFNEIYPNVAFQTAPVQAGDYLQKIQTSMASGLELPDVIYAESDSRIRTFQLGLCENLEAEPYNIDRNDMFEYLWPRCEYEGNIVGLEMQLTPAALGYRKDITKEVWGVEEAADIEKLFADAGGDYNSYITLGKQLLEKTDGQKLMFSSLGDVKTLVYNQSKQPLVNEDGSLNLSGRIMPCLTVMRDFVQAGIVGTIDQWTPQWEASFATGTYAFFPFATWTTEPVENDRDPDGAGHWGLCIPPMGAFSWGGTTQSLNKQSPNKESAWAYISWCTWSLEGSKAALEGRGYLNSRISNYDKDPSLSSSYSDYYGMDLPKFWIEEAVASAVTVTPTEYEQLVGDALGVAMTAFQADTAMSAEDMMEIVKTEIHNKEPNLELK